MTAKTLSPLSNEELLKAHYSLWLADICQAAQVVLNSVRFDKRLASYISEDSSNRDSQDVRDLLPILSSLEAELQKKIVEPFKELYKDIQQSRLTAFDEIIDKRTEIGNVFAHYLKLAGAVHNHLHSIVTAGPPEVLDKWSSMESSDRSVLQMVIKTAQSFASSLSTWTSPHILGTTESSIKVHLAVDWEHHSIPYNTHQWISSSEVHISLTVPFWMLYLYRYCPSFAHELAHPFASRLVTKHPALEKDFLYTERFIYELHEYYVANAAQHFPSIGKTILFEIMCDVLALGVAGPSYLFSLAYMGTGLTKLSAPEIKGAGWLPSVPLAVRLRTLIHVIDRHYPHWKDAMPVLFRSLDAQITQYSQWTEEQRPIFFRMKNELIKAACAYSNALFDRLGAFSFHTKNSPSNSSSSLSESVYQSLAAEKFAFDDTKKIHSEVFLKAPISSSIPNVLWSITDGFYWKSSSQHDLLDTLQSVPEGKIFTILSLPPDDNHRVRYSLGEPWDLIQGKTYVPLSQQSFPCQSLQALLSELIAPMLSTSETEQQISALCLGLFDFLSLRKGFRIRRSDSIHEKNFPWPVYLKRNIYIEVTQILSQDHTLLYPFSQKNEAISPSLAPLLVAPIKAISEIQLDTPQHINNFFEQLFSLDVVQQGHIQPAKIFLGVGWNDLCILWNARFLQDLKQLHSDFLTTFYLSSVPVAEKLHNCGGIKRSVTHFLSHAYLEGVGIETPCFRKLWHPEPCAPSFSVNSSLRTHGATQINALTTELKQSWTGHPSDLTVYPVFGLDDLRADFVLRDHYDLIRVSQTLWNSVLHGTAIRSFSHLALHPLPQKQEQHTI